MKNYSFLTSVILKIHGGALKFEHSYNILSCNNATETCDMAMERQFRGIPEFVQFLKLRPLFKRTDWFKQDLANFNKIAS